jgi:hypothetical protein
VKAGEFDRGQRGSAHAIVGCHNTGWPLRRGGSGHSPRRREDDRPCRECFLLYVRPTAKARFSTSRICLFQHAVRRPGRVRGSAWRGYGSIRTIDQGEARKPARAGHAIMNSIVSSVERAALPSDPHMGLTALSIHTGLQRGRRIEAAPCDTERTT